MNDEKSNLDGIELGNEILKSFYRFTLARTIFKYGGLVILCMGVEAQFGGEYGTVVFGLGLFAGQKWF